MTTDRVNELLHLFSGVPIARYIGMQLSYTEDNSAIVDLPYNPSLNHGLGGIHGGVYATLLDTAGWFTAAATREMGQWVATSEMSMHLLKATEQTPLRAVGKLIKQGKRQDVVEMHLYDGDGNLVAHATGTFVPLPGVPIRRHR